MPNGFDIYSAVTDRILEQLESGAIPWNKPWTGVSGGAVRRTNGRSYSLLNQLLLGEPGEYLTFKQCKDEGGTIKKGAKSKIVVFWKFIETERKDINGRVMVTKDGEIRMQQVPFLRYYNVFHLDDCEGVAPKWTDDKKAMHDIKPIEAAQKIMNDYVTRENIELEHVKGDRAFYKPSEDKIVLPLFEQFETPEGYYETAFHEGVHSTGHKKRLDRISDDLSDSRFGSEKYSKEELVAEIGSCAIMHEIGIETDKTIRNNAAYIQSWLKVLKNDKHMIVSAAGKAEKAVNFILGHAMDCGSD